MPSHSRFGSIPAARRRAARRGEVQHTFLAELHLSAGDRIDLPQRQVHVVFRADDGTTGLPHELEARVAALTRFQRELGVDGVAALVREIDRDVEVAGIDINEHAETGYEMSDGYGGAFAGSAGSVSAKTKEEVSA